MNLFRERAEIQRDDEEITKDLDETTALQGAILHYTQALAETIPPEIWGEIFSLAVSEDVDSFYDDKRHGLPPFTALKLSAVCQYWRGIAANHPGLWQHIAIPHHHSISFSQRDRIVHYKTRCSPFLPTVYTYTHNNIIVGKHTVDFAEFMRGTFSEYELDILARGSSFGRYTTPTDFLQALSPHVQTLQLAGYPGNELPIFIGQIRTTHIPIDTLCNVKHLKIKDRPIHIIRTSSGVTTLSITSLALENLHMDASHLKSCLPPLRHLERLSIVNVTFHSGIAIGRIMLPTLKRLGCDFSLYPYLARLINMPELQDLSLIINPTTDSQVGEWLGYNNPIRVIHSLTLRASQAEESEYDALYFRILDHFSNVQALCLDGTPPTSYLLSPSTTLAPFASLQSLIIADSAIAEADLAGFMQRFAAWYQRTPALTIHNCANLDVNAIKRLSLIHI